MAVQPLTLDEQMAGWWNVETDLANGQIQRAALTEANRYVAGNVLANMRRIVGPSMTLGNYPGKIKAKVKVNGDRSTLEFTPAGLFAIISEGTKAHAIPRPNAAVTRFASGRFASGPIRHPGMGRLGRPLKDTLRDMDAEFLEVYGDEIDRRVLK